jgi:hypothetical protein
MQAPPRRATIAPPPAAHAYRTQQLRTGCSRRTASSRFVQHPGTCYGPRITYRRRRYIYCGVKVCVQAVVHEQQDTTLPDDHLDAPDAERGPKTKAPKPLAALGKHSEELQSQVRAAFFACTGGCSRKSRRESLRSRACALRRRASCGSIVRCLCRRRPLLC